MTGNIRGRAKSRGGTAWGTGSIAFATRSRRLYAGRMSAPARVPDAAEPTIAELLAARPQFRMHPMDGLLLEDVPLARIAAELGTPAWVYSAGTMRARLAELKAAHGRAGAHIHYAMKANDHLAVLRLFAAGRLRRRRGERRRTAPRPRRRHRSRRASSSPASARPSAKSRLALAEDIAPDQRRKRRPNWRRSPPSPPPWAAPPALRCASTRTSMPARTPRSPPARRRTSSASPLLMPPRSMRTPPSLPGVEPVGLALHLGSQIRSMAPYRAAFARAAELVRTLRAAGRDRAAHGLRRRLRHRLPRRADCLPGRARGGDARGVRAGSDSRS